MEISKKRVVFWSSSTGVLGAGLIACTACCLPFLAPVFAWLAVAGLTFMGHYGLIAGLLGAVIIGLTMYLRQRRRLQCQKSAGPAASACNAGCGTNEKHGRLG